MRVLTLLIATVLAQGWALAKPVAYVNLDVKEFAALDLVTGNLTAIGDTPNALTGLAWAANQLYGIDVLGNLLTIDPSTAATAYVGSTGVSFTTFGGTTGGNLYGLDHANNLYRVNRSTGAALLIGPTGLPAIHEHDYWANGLAGDNTSLYYVYELSGSDTVASSLYRLNVLTGAATLIGLTGAAELEALGYIDGTLYGFGGNLLAHANNNRIFTLSTATGVAIQVGSYVVGDAAILGVVPIPEIAPGVPEPATTALVAGGWIALIAALRRRSHTC